MSADPIGYAEQEETVRALSRHYTGGALDVDAFDARVRRARAATTRSELAALFTDLPEPHPASLAGVAPPPSAAGDDPGGGPTGAGPTTTGSSATDPTSADPATTGATARTGTSTGSGSADAHDDGHGGDAERTARFAVPGPTRATPYPDPSGHHPAAGPYPDPSPTTAGTRPPWPAPGAPGYPGAGYPGGPYPDGGPAGMSPGGGFPGGGFPGGPAWAAGAPGWASGQPQHPGAAYPPHPGPPSYGSYGYDPSAPYGREPYSGLPYSDKQKIVAGLLQLFLPFGIGRFYSGHTGLAVAQLLVTFLTFGIGAIWSFVDGIVVLAGSPRDPAGRPLRP
ncbi:DUF1707 domain-containing protein [Pseudonocardia sp. ICBG1034]|uniref:DUF1707 domain-containing protein n=1 Tax=Pseudonocardia sp. ICBG1034 TaxID=2844381 RepID=UPI001CCA5FA7|nr:DUF1707 domain-containing protein [Pseudonocardia sp. ICBG1034]